MARDYIELSIDGGSTYKRYDLMLTTEPVIPIPRTPSEVSDTLEGTGTIAYGVSKDTWSFLLKVIYADTRANYGTMANCKAIFSSTTATANNVRLRLRDYDVVATTYQTVVTNKTEPEVRCLTPDHYAADAVYTVRLRLRQI